MEKFMKVFSIALACLLIAGGIGCTRKKTTETLSVSPRTLEFEAEGGSRNVTVVGKNWTATASALWLKADKADGVIVVTVDANESPEPRTALVIVENGDGSQNVTVNQKGFEATAPFTVNPEELSFAFGGDTETVMVTSETEWTTTPSADWIVIGDSEGGFTVTVGANPDTHHPRSGEIIVDNGTDTKTVSVTQASEYLHLTSGYGRYHGYRYANFGYETSNYSLALFDVGVDEEGNLITGGLALIVDFFGEDPDDIMYPVIPAGNYTVELVSEPYKVIPNNSYLIELDLMGMPSGDEIGIVGGGFELTGDADSYTITFDFELRDGTSFKAYWDGRIDIRQDVYDTTLRGDLEIPTMTGGGYIDYYGEYYDNPAVYDYLVWLWSSGLSMGNNGLEGNGDYLMLEFLSEGADATAIPSGTYVIDDSFGPDTVPAGSFNMVPIFAWYNTIENGFPVESAPLVSGEITVSSTNGLYEIEVDAYDDAGNHITGRYEGRPEFTDAS